MPPPPAKAAAVRFYRPELDVLRFVAFFLVFSHHALGALGSSTTFTNIGLACGSGLQLFFLLSSFLITELLLRERERTNKIHIRAFFARRILRIWPLYFLFVIASLVISKFTHFTILTTFQFAAYMLLAGNWWNAFHGFVPTIAGPLWSISLEEQFYLLWPFISKRGVRAVWIASAFFLCASTSAICYLGIHHAYRYALWCNSFVEFQFFAAGAILALLLRNCSYAPSWKWRWVMLAAALGAIGTGQFVFHVMNNFTGAGDLLAGYGLWTLGVSLIFLSIYQAALPKLASPVIYLGRISYGLYVFHYLSLRIAYLGSPCTSSASAS
jgi:peptidoglycan/LPS O-acetylase OafA/YrhL